MTDPKRQITLSIPDSTRTKLEERAAALRMTYSGYVSALIEADAKRAAKREAK